MTAPSTWNDIFNIIFNEFDQLNYQSEKYDSLAQKIKLLVEQSHFASSKEEAVDFQPFGKIQLPFHKMGAITTLDLFGLDELIIFAFYWLNRHRYQRSADIGANMGIHSILMDKCGWNVTAFEPDPNHVQRLRFNLQLNKSHHVTVVEAAVSKEAGTMDFVRVLGNTTSNHLVGAKDNAYGDLEVFPVKVVSIKEIMRAVNFVKMDAEGQEKVIILGTDQEDWKSTDMMVEIGSHENASAVFNHLQNLGLHAFAQKIGWKEVKILDDVPKHYKEGSLFITCNSSMPLASV